MDRWTIPLNPLTLVNMIVELALMPAGMMSERGLAAIMKSGGGPDGIIVRKRLTMCDMPPSVPVTLIFHLFEEDEVVEKVSLDEFVPPALS